MARQKHPAKHSPSLSDWCVRIIGGPGGLLEFERRELAEIDASPHVAGAIWAIRCLANPRCRDSERVLEFVLRRREKLACQAEEEASNATSQLTLTD